MAQLQVTWVFSTMQISRSGITGITSHNNRKRWRCNSSGQRGSGAQGRLQLIRPLEHRSASRFDLELRSSRGSGSSGYQGEGERDGRGERSGMGGWPGQEEISGNLGSGGDLASRGSEGVAPPGWMAAWWDRDWGIDLGFGAYIHTCCWASLFFGLPGQNHVLKRGRVEAGTGDSIPSPSPLYPTGTTLAPITSLRALILYHLRPLIEEFTSGNRGSDPCCHPYLWVAHHKIAVEIHVRSIILEWSTLSKIIWFHI
jgi:hypothetical protein